MKSTTRIGVAAAVVAALSVVGAPAGAATWEATDAQHDVVRGGADDPDLADAVPAPQRRSGDITGVRVDHDRRVVVTVDHDRLRRPTGRVQVVHLVTVRTHGRDRDLAVVADRAHPGGQVVEAPCRATRARIDYATATVVVSVPRRCLGSPGAVRVGAGTGTLVRGSVLADDALTDGTVGERLELGPRIRR